MSRKVTVELKVKLLINMDEGIEVADVVNEMEYMFYDPEDMGARIEDMEITDYEIIDSK